MSSGWRLGSNSCSSSRVSLKDWPLLSTSCSKEISLVWWSTLLLLVWRSTFTKPGQQQHQQHVRKYFHSERTKNMTWKFEIFRIPESLRESFWRFHNHQLVQSLMQYERFELIVCILFLYNFSLSTKTQENVRWRQKKTFRVLQFHYNLHGQLVKTGHEFKINIVAYF